MNGRLFSGSRHPVLSVRNWVDSGMAAFGFAIGVNDRLFMELATAATDRLEAFRNFRRNGRYCRTRHSCFNEEAGSIALRLDVRSLDT